jgi:hypothetical protein
MDFIIIPTDAQIELMSGAQLTAFWNANCARVGKTPIKKFTDRAQGIKRCTELASFLRKENGLTEPVTAEPVTAEPVIAEPVKKAGRKPTVSGTCQQLIRQGLSNAEIWIIVKEQFRLDDSKKYYPAWNRAMMVRKGLIKREG